MIHKNSAISDQSATPPMIPKTTPRPAFNPDGSSSSEGGT